MDKQKVEWYIQSLEVFISMLKEEILCVEPKNKPEVEINSFENFHPIDFDEDIEYYEEEN